MLLTVMNLPPLVFVLQHLHILDNGEEDVKLIGVYDSRAAAENAAERLADKPGFRDWSKVVDPEQDSQKNGFYIDQYRIGEDHWTSGYVTIPDGKT